MTLKQTIYFLIDHVCSTTKHTHMMRSMNSSCKSNPRWSAISTRSKEYNPLHANYFFTPKTIGNKMFILVFSFMFKHKLIFLFHLQKCQKGPLRLYLKVFRAALLWSDHLIYLWDSNCKVLTGTIVSSLMFACVPQRAPSDVGGWGIQWQRFSWGQDILTAQWQTIGWSCHLWNRWSSFTTPNIVHAIYLQVVTIRVESR